MPLKLPQASDYWVIDRYMLALASAADSLVVTPAAEMSVLPQPLFQSGKVSRSENLP